MKQQIQKKLATELGGFHDTLHLVLCLFAILDERISVKSLPVKPHMGIALLKVRYIMASKVIYWSIHKVIATITVTQANIDERESLWDLVAGIDGMIITDKGLIGVDYKNELYQFTGIDLQTAVRSKMEEKRSKKFLK